jgi:hypothetical protein
MASKAKESSLSRRWPPRARGGSRRTFLNIYIYLSLFFCLVILYLRYFRVSVVLPGSSPPILQSFPQEERWHKYVRASQSTTISAVAVLSQYTSGNVTNPDGLITGNGPTVLSRLTPGDAIPGLVVDFGMNTVGILSLKFAGARRLSHGLPGLRLAFSETLEFLSGVSDFSRSYNVGHPGHNHELANS